MAVNLTSGAITKISTGKCTENDLKPVLQVISIDSRLKRSINDKQWYLVVLSDGSFKQFGCIPDEIFISNKLQKGSIVQLTKFQLAKLFHSKDEIISKSGISVCDLNILRPTCDIIGVPKPLHHMETPLVERTTPTIPYEDHANSHLNENIDDSRHHVEEPPTSVQNPSTSTQKSSSHSLTQNKKRKLQSSDDDINSGFEKDISKLVSMIVDEKIIEDGLGACYKKLGTLEEVVSKMTKLMMEKSKEVDAGFKKLETLEEDVSKLTKLMMEKSKEVDAGFKKLETLEEDVSKLTKLMMEKNKEDVVGFKKLETPEEDVSKLTKLMMEKNKEDVVGFKKLETLEEDVSKLTKLMMEKNKEDVVGFKKLETLEEDVSKLTKLMMEKNKEDVVGFKKLETLEEDVSKMTRMMMEKNQEDVVGFKKLETLEEDVSKLTRMMMEKNKEDDMGACIEKLDKMGWGSEEPIYDTALLLFLKGADYRKLWLHLKPECCGKWVKIAGSIFGLLD